MRRLLPLAMLVSLWPVGAVAVSIAAASTHKSSQSVTVTGPSGSKTTVHLNLNGKTYECPLGTGDKLKPVDQQIGELQVTLKSVRSQLRSKLARLRQLDSQYPGHTAPKPIADEYNGLLRTGRRLEAQETQLVTRYNAAVDQHNHIITSNCN